MQKTDKYILVPIEEAILNIDAVEGVPYRESDGGAIHIPVRSLIRGWAVDCISITKAEYKRGVRDGEVYPVATTRLNEPLVRKIRR